LGRYGSATAQNAYDALIGEWLSRGRTLPPSATGFTVSQAIAAYLRYAKGYYVKDGQQTSEFHCLIAAMRPLRALYGKTPADSFDSIGLQSVMRRMVEEGLARKTINDHVHRIRRAFRWTASQRLVSDVVVASLATVAALKRGRSAARETQKKKPVPQ